MENIYTSGEYLQKNATWGHEDAKWKSQQVLKMINRNHLKLDSIADIGCGSGGVLEELHQVMPSHTKFYGYEISPQAIELCHQIKKERIQFTLSGVSDIKNKQFDLAMALDVFEHLEDYYAFLRALCEKSQYKVFHIPLELCVQTILRVKPLLGARQSVGHLHYFTKEIAITVLKETGYQVLDYFYTFDSFKESAKSFRTLFAKIPRSILFAIHQDFAARLLGGFSLLVLAK